MLSLLNFIKPWSIPKFLPLKEATEATGHEHTLDCTALAAVKSTLWEQQPHHTSLRDALCDSEMIENAIKKTISEVSKPRNPKSVKIKGPRGPQCLAQLPKAGQELVKGDDT